MLVDVRVHFPGGGTLFEEDPALGATRERAADSAMMGDIARVYADSVRLRIEVLASAPIERLQIFNGLELLETVRPYAAAELGNRIRVVWEGAEYRGRFRQTIWDGEATVSENTILRAEPINFFNLDKTLERITGNRLRWRALTTGNFGGFDIWVEDAYAGTLKLETPLVQCGVPLEELGYDEEVFDRSATLPRFVRIARLPAENAHRRLNLERDIAIVPGRDNPLFVKLTQEDGHVAWSSPIYLWR